MIAAPLSTTGGGQTGGSVALAVSGGTGTITLAQNITTAAGAISLAGPTVLGAKSRSIRRIAASTAPALPFRSPARSTARTI